MDTRDIDEKLEKLFAESAERAWENLPAELKLCESPIEKLFFCAAWSRWGWIGRLQVLYLPLKVLRDYASGDPTAWCSPQVDVGPYRVDFMFAQGLMGGKVGLVAVECDGHEFHEKTKQQAARDKARDRYLMSQGIRIFRFTGSEVWKDAGVCADEVLCFLQGESVDELWRFERMSNVKVIREEQQ